MTADDTLSGHPPCAEGVCAVCGHSRPCPTEQAVRKWIGDEPFDRQADTALCPERKETSR